MLTTNNRASFYLQRKENLVKRQKVSKYYENDCSSRPLYKKLKLCISLDQLSEML